MSLLRTYGGPGQMTREALEVWINQIEDITVAKTVAIKVNKTNRMTHLVVDLEVKKPDAKVSVLMGHLPAGPGALTGQAYVLSQPMDVTLSR